jgi:hypothetical protein
MKGNMRSLWLFGGFSLLKFNTFFPQMNSPIDREDLYRMYQQLSGHDMIFFDYTDNGTDVRPIFLE